MSDRLNLEPLLDTVDLVELAQQVGAPLKKSGKAWHSACPLHRGDNPTAFVVWPNTRTWHCFTVCNAGGDALDLVMRWQGGDFIDAVKWLAAWARIDLARLNWTPEAIEAHRKEIAVSTLLTYAAQVFQRQMWLVDEAGQRVYSAANYALNRSFSEAHLKAAGWGFSHADDALLHALKREAAELVPLAYEIGLIRADGKDFCANANGANVSPAGWLIYPHIKGGKVVYLSARALNPTTKDKSRNLPGPRQVYRADTDLRFTADQGVRLRDDGLVLVEGPADAESCRAWGWPTWAMCGAPIDEADNPHLIAALRKTAQHATIYAAMSHDVAGRKFAEKIAGTLGPLTRIVLWPKTTPDAPKSDANECLQRGLADDEIAELFDRSETYLDLVIDQVARLRDVRKKAEGIERLASLVAQLSETERKVYVGKVAEAGIDISRREFEKLVEERLPRSSESAIETEGGRFTYFGEPLSNFTARVESELMIDDGQNPPSIEYHVVGQLADGTPLPAIDVPAEEFDGMKWIGKSWGVRAFALVGSGKLHLLRRAMLEASLKDIRSERVYTFTGFYTINGEPAFLTASGALTARGLNSSARVDLPNNLAHYWLPEPKRGEDLLQAVRYSLGFIDLGRPMVTVPLWAAMYAAPLTSLKPLNTVLWVYGPTQSKKSSIGHLALTHFGPGFVDGRQYKAPKDWQSTAADLEATMFTCKDVPLIIDDYAPQFTGAQESRDIAKRAHAVVRSVGNRASRGRRKADMTARAQFLPRGLVIATAEQPLIGQSIVGRTLTVPVEFGAVDLDALTERQANKHFFGMAMAGYVQWLLSNWERVKETSTRLVEKSLLEMRGSFPNQDRLSDYYAALRLGTHLALTFAGEIGAIDDAGAREAAYTVDLLELLEGQSQRISEQSPVVKFFMALDELIGSDKLALMPVSVIAFDQVKGQAESIPEVPYGQNLVGWRKPDLRQVWLLSAPALAAVKEYWAALDERFDTLLDALRREMLQLGYLAERDEGQIERPKWINTKYRTRRVLIVDAGRVRDKLGIDLLGEDSEK